MRLAVFAFVSLAAVVAFAVFGMLSGLGAWEIALRIVVALVVLQVGYFLVLLVVGRLPRNDGWSGENRREIIEKPRGGRVNEARD